MTRVPKMYIYAAAAVAGVILIVLLLQSLRSNAVRDERWRVADSTAKAEQKNRLRVETAAAIAQARADSLAAAVAVLTTRANAAAGRAEVAERDAAGARRDRDRAAAALKSAGTTADTVTALLSKSTADDSVIASQSRVITAKSEEVVALRSALDSSSLARLQLSTALDSARAQLTRDGRVIQQLQTVKGARAAHLTRLQPYGEALVDPADTKSVIARAGLQANLTGHLAFVAAGERAFMPNHNQSRWLVGGRWNFR